MKNGPLLFVIFTFGVLAVAGPLLAHHGQVEYEAKSVTLKGTVTKFEWSNPHVIISFAATADNGKSADWYAEVLPPARMVRAGWTKESIKPGDQVTLIGRPGKKGAHIMWLDYLVTPSGQKLGRDAGTP